MPVVATPDPWTASLLMGRRMNSFCGGFFGRDFFGGTIEAVGHDWIIARSFVTHLPAFAYLPGGLTKPENASMIRRWLEDKAYDWDE